MSVAYIDETPERRVVFSQQPSDSLVDFIRLAMAREAELWEAGETFREESRRIGSHIARAKRNGDADEYRRLKMVHEARMSNRGPQRPMRDVIAEEFGISSATYQRAKRVITHADEHPELYGDLLVSLNEQGASTAERLLVERLEAAKANEEPKAKPKPQGDGVSPVAGRLTNAMASLRGIAEAVESLDVSSISPAEAETQMHELGESMAVLNGFYLRLREHRNNHDHDQEDTDG